MQDQAFRKRFVGRDASKEAPGRFYRGALCRLVLPFTCSTLIPRNRISLSAELIILCQKRQSAATDKLMIPRGDYDVNNRESGYEQQISGSALY